MGILSRLAMPLALKNRYLLTPSGRQLGSRLLPALVTLGPIIGGPVIGVVLAGIGALLDVGLIAGLGALLGFALFLGGVVAAWAFLLGGSRANNDASQMWLAGDYVGPIALCQKSLARVFRADVRMRAFYTLGLCAEANGDFLEAADLFQRAFEAVPAMAAQKWKRRGQCMMLSHSAIALVALGRLDEADRAVRMASALFPLLPGGGLVDALSDDAAFGAAGVSAALRDLELGRDHRALLSLATLTVLTARGMAREALELADRERHALTTGLLPREHALLSTIEARSHGLLGGGPMRSPGHAMTPHFDGNSAAWANRILAMRP